MCTFLIIPSQNNYILREDCTSGYCLGISILWLFGRLTQFPSFKFRIFRDNARSHIHRSSSFLFPLLLIMIIFLTHVLFRPTNSPVVPRENDSAASKKTLLCFYKVISRRVVLLDIKLKCDHSRSALGISCRFIVCKALDRERRDLGVDFVFYRVKFRWHSFLFTRDIFLCRCTGRPWVKTIKTVLEILSSSNRTGISVLDIGKVSRARENTNVLYRVSAKSRRATLR